METQKIESPMSHKETNQETLENIDRIRQRLLNLDQPEDREAAIQELERDYKLNTNELESREREAARTDLNDKEFQNLAALGENIQALESMVKLGNIEGLKKFIPEWRRVNRIDQYSEVLQGIVVKIENTLEEIENIYKEKQWPLAEERQNELLNFLESFCNAHNLDLAGHTLLTTGNIQRKSIEIKQFHVAKRVPACEIRRMAMESGQEVYYPDKYSALMMYGPTVLEKRGGPSE